MRPYNVEIFDRAINFKYSFLLDASELNYSEDAMDPVKNTIPTPADFIPAELDPSDERAPRGWYLRILCDDFEIQGMITVFESGEGRGKLTFSQMITCLDLNMLVDVGSLSQSSIEIYIKNLIEKEFVNSSDSKQNLTGLFGRVFTSSFTRGTFDFADTDDSQVAIDFLDDLVYPAFELYSVVTKVTFDPVYKRMEVRIGRSYNDPITIEADLQNITESEFTIQKYSKEVNKVDCFDISQSPPDRNEFYLHTTGSWDSDAVNNRIVPVINSIVQINGWAAAKAVIDAELNAEYAFFTEANERPESLKDSELVAFDAFLAKIMPGYIARHPLTAPTIQGSDSVEVDTTEYHTRQAAYTEYVSGFHWTVEPQTSQPVLIADTTSCLVHTRLEARVTAKITVGGVQYTSNDRYLQKPFTNQMANEAFTIYKNGASYEAEIRAVYEQIVSDEMEARAGLIFAKNKYSNLIELTMLQDDSMVKPLTRALGIPVNVIHKGVSYSSILSGRSINKGLVTLTFGTIRLELTSFLKGRY